MRLTATSTTGRPQQRWREGEEASRRRDGDPNFAAELVELREAQKDLNFIKEFGEREFAVYAKDASERLGPPRHEQEPALHGRRPVRNDGDAQARGPHS